MRKPDDFSPRGRPVKFCTECGRNLTLGVFGRHEPCPVWVYRAKHAAQQDWQDFVATRHEVQVDELFPF